MNTPKTAIRLTVNKEVRDALRIAKRRFPTLSDPEILKLGLSKIVYESRGMQEADEIMSIASSSVGYDYLNDPEEDVYSKLVVKKV